MAQTATIQRIDSAESVKTISAYQRVLSPFDLQMRSDLADAFFPVSDFFTEPITYIHSAPASVSTTYSAYFEDPSREVSPRSQVKITTLHPMIELNQFAMAQYPKINDVIIVRGIRYSIDFIDYDGTGVIRIYLVREGKSVK